MKKFFNFLVLFSCSFFLLNCISCSDGVTSSALDQDTVITGSISGKVIYSNINETNHSGIIIALDKTDGLKSRAVIDNTLTAEDGSYLFENLEPGTYTVYAASSDSTEKAVSTNVIVNATEITIAEDLMLTATGSLSGKITLDNSENNNAGFVVFAAGTSYMAVTGTDGVFKLTGLPANTDFQIIVMKGAYTYLWKTNIKSQAFATTNIGELNLDSEEMKLFAKDGADGKNGTNGINGTNGTNGTNGQDGAPGKDGTSIIWKGSFESADDLENPQYLWAFFNTSDGSSYIYDGKKWTLLAAAGQSSSSENIVTEVTIEYDLKGGSLPEGAPTTHKYGTTTTLVEPNPRTGYYFTGYYILKDSALVPVTTLGDDYVIGQKIYAGWKECYKLWYLDYDNNILGIFDYSPKELEDTLVLLPDDFELNREDCGYTFKNWRVVQEWNGNIFSVPVSEIQPGACLKDLLSDEYPLIILCATYSPITYTISYNYPEQVNNSDNPVSYNVTKNIFINDVVINGNNYGWVIDGTDTVCTGWAQGEQIGNLVLTLNYVNNIKYELNAGINDSRNPDNYLPDAAVTLYAPTKNGCEFLGWYTNSKFEGEPITGWAEGTTNGHITLYAKWYNPIIETIKETTESTTLRLSGEIVESDLKDIVNAINTLHAANPQIEIGLDLLNTTGLTLLSSDTFAGCTGLSSIALPNSLQTIKDYAFDGCSGLKDVIFDEQSRLTGMGEYAFKNCTSLTNINLQDRVAGIREGAFYNCTNLKNIRMPEKLQTIKTNAFYNCQNIESLTIPASNLRKIHENAFVDCSIKHLFFYYNFRSIEEIIFQSCFVKEFYFLGDFSEINLPEYCLFISNEAPLDYDGCHFIHPAGEDEWYLTEYNEESSEVILPESIDETSINEYVIYGAFYGNKNITKITIPDSVTEISTSSFNGCSNLVSANFPSGSSWNIIEHSDSDYETPIANISTSDYTASELSVMLTTTYKDYKWEKVQ